MDSSPSHSSLPLTLSLSPEVVLREAGMSPRRTSSIRESIRSGHLDPTTIQIDPSVAESSEPPTVCPICLEPFDNAAQVIPCFHQFDLGCIRQWLRTTIGGMWCPLCRTDVDEVRHNFTAAGQFTTVSVYEIVDDDAVLPGMTNREIHAARERRRVRGRERTYIRMAKTWPRYTPSYCVRYKNHLDTVSEDHLLYVKQDGVVTTSVLTTVLSIRFQQMDSFPEPPEYRTDREAMKAFEWAHTRYRRP